MALRGRKLLSNFLEWIGPTNVANLVLEFCYDIKTAVAGICL